MPKWFPNFLSIVRLCIAVMFPFVNSDLWISVIVIAGLTEWADGFLARRYCVVTVLGQALDPIADKVLFLSVLGTLMYLGVLSWWHLLLLSLRELAILSGIVWVFFKRRQHMFATFLPKQSGKWATVAQYVYFFSLLYTKNSDPVIFAITAVVGAWAAADYIYWFITSWRRYTAQQFGPGVAVTP
jgi:cardiolipin synthase